MANKPLRSIKFPGLPDTYEVVQADLSVNEPTDPRYVHGRTHYVGDPVETILIPEQTVAFANMDGLMAAESPVTVELVEGQTYTVNFDGVTYECVCHVLSEGQQIRYIGSPTAFGLDDTGEPFMYGYTYSSSGEVVEALWAAYNTETEHTLFLSSLERQVVQLPAKFLMNSNVRNGERNGSIIEGIDTAATGLGSHAEGAVTVASGDCSHAEGRGTNASGDCSHAEGCLTVASKGCSHAEGYKTIARWDNSHAEGEYTVAYLGSSHAEGRYTVAGGFGSHAEGYGDIVKEIPITGGAGSTSYTFFPAYDEDIPDIGDFILLNGVGSFVVGWDPATKTITLDHTLDANNALTGTYVKWLRGGTAKGDYSHVEGIGTKASGDYQHVQGKYNINDPEGKYAHIVGNGKTISVRSNAHTLDWKGNAWFAGMVEGTAIILKSSTEGSSKHFKITVDDSGTLTATEVTK